MKRLNQGPENVTVCAPIEPTTRKNDFRDEDMGHKGTCGGIGMSPGCPLVNNKTKSCLRQ